jgi:hypothetical protein
MATGDEKESTDRRRELEIAWDSLRSTVAWGKKRVEETGTTSAEIF